MVGRLVRTGCGGIKASPKSDQQAGRCCRPALRWAAAAWLLAGAAVWSEAGQPLGTTRDPAPSSGIGSDAVVFESGWVPDIVLDLGPAEQEALRQNPRAYVPATMRVGTNLFGQVGVHLKGKTSFRPLDARPSLTISLDRFVPGQRFGGLTKLHLHNAVDDPTLLNEWLGSELFRAAGLPAARVGHARLQLNGRKLGLYVLKEGFTPEFLAAHFPAPHGNLFEPVEGSDIDGRMSLDAGPGHDAGQGLRALAAAAQEPDPDRRWARLESVLDLDRFLTFVAMEILLGHRDGYCLARNNFRVYEPPPPGKIVFVPHGMDVLLGNPDLPVQPHMAGLVAQAVMTCPVGRVRYRERLGTLLTNLLRVDQVAERLDRRLGALEASLSRAERRQLSRGASLIKERLAARAASVARQLAEPEPAVLQFVAGVAQLSCWQPVDPPDGGRLAQVRTQDGRLALWIQAGPVTAASWRTRVRLPQGRYRFEGQVKVAGVVPLPYGRNHGAGLRVVGWGGLPPHDLAGDSAWKLLAIQFAVTNLVADVELACELRAAAGQAWFDLGSLRLVQVP